MSRSIFDILSTPEYFAATNRGKHDFGNTLYHYTSPSGLLGILRRDKCVLWFTKYDSLNDASERIEILSFSKRYCERKIREGVFSEEYAQAIMNVQLSDMHGIIYPPTLTDRIDEEQGMRCIGRAESTACDTYLCCFSEDPDSLPMWNYYSKSNDYQGYRIGFLHNYISDISNIGKGYSIHFRRVIYDESEKTEIFDAIFMPLYDFYREGNSADKSAALQQVQTVINNFQYVFKNECFKHEKEVRAILQVPRFLENATALFAVKYRSGHGYIIPYIEFEFAKQAIMNITVAPLSNSDVAISNLKQMLRDNHYATCVCPSKIPIRY